MRIATTVSALGQGRFDGEEAFIRFGTEDGAEVTWDEANSFWRGEEHKMFQLHSVPLVGGSVPGTWVYLYLPDGNPGSYNRSDFGWNPEQINNAGQAFSAGLTLQENVQGCIQQVVSGTAAQIATVLYPFDTGDSIAGSINPVPYISTIVNAVSSRTYTGSGGWVDSPFDAALVNGKPVLAPHLYVRPVTGGTGVNVFSLLVKWRWSGSLT